MPQSPRYGVRHDRRVSTATERHALCGFLDQARDALIRKVDGLSDTDARQAATVSLLSLLSLIKHAAIWERPWFQIIFAGRSFPDEWPAADEATDATFELSDGGHGRERSGLLPGADRDLPADHCQR
jgi:hypothetical protein